MELSATPYFSVIIPTRNRPALFREALNSVLAQSFRELEIIVINDGSADELLADYHTLERNCDARVKWHYLLQLPNGHGQSYAMNSGASLAVGNYLCFLDDDDTWCDPEHLQRAHTALLTADSAVDALYCNQKAYNSQGELNPDKLWIADLETRLGSQKQITEYAYRVTSEFLLSSRGFAHLNCSIIRRALYLDMGGMDEDIRYECDRDIYLRTLDAARCILYSPVYSARHNIPDPAKKDNMSTLAGDLEKRLYQVSVLKKAVLRARRESVRCYATRALSDIYKHLTGIQLGNGRIATASEHANQALALRYTLKWHGYCLYLALRRRFSF